MGRSLTVLRVTGAAAHCPRALRRSPLRVAHQVGVAVVRLGARVVGGGGARGVGEEVGVGAVVADGESPLLVEDALREGLDAVEGAPADEA